MTKEELTEEYNDIRMEDEEWFGHEEGYTHEDAFNHYQDLFNSLDSLIRRYLKGEEQ